MKADTHIATYRRLRAQPLWRLLAADHGPVVIGLLQSLLYDDERRLPASILFERLARALEELRAQGDDLPQTAQAYVAGWLADGDQQPLDGAPASCPLRWDEVKPGLDPAAFTIKTIPERFARMPDPMAGVLGEGIDISAALARIEQAQ